MDLNWLIYPLSFLATLGVVVTIHEFGHFIVARFYGVKVIRFSVGFGKVLVSKYDRQGTEFCICAIPLGGYVRMLDSRQDEIKPSEVDMDFSNKPVAARLAVFAAGPVINLLFAVVVFMVYALLGVTELKPVVGSVDVNSIAAKAGLRPGEVIIEIDNKAVSTWEEVSFRFIEFAGTTGVLPITVSVEPNRTESGDSEFRAASVRSLQLLVTDFMNGDLGPLEELGIIPSIHLVPAVIGSISPGLPAAAALWQAGDKITRLDQQPISHWKELYSYIRDNPSKFIEYELIRDQEILTGTILPETTIIARPKGQSGESQTVGRVGAGPAPYEIDPDMTRLVTYNPVSALFFGIEQTWVRTRLVLISIGKLLTGALAIDNVTGPVTIAEIAGKTAQIGLSSMLNFLAYLSISLGVFNLLPVPMLDGGHIAYGIVEWIRGKPLSMKIQQLGMTVGLALLGGVMVLAFFNDFVRLFT